MLNLIRADLFRIKFKKILYVAFIALALIAIFYIGTADDIEINEIVAKSLTFGSVLLPLFFIPIYLYIWQRDFGTRFVNTILISGISRSKYYVTKLILTYLVGGILVIGYSVSVFIYSYLTLGKFSLSEMLLAAGVQLLLYFVVMTVGLMIYILVDSVALSTTVYLLFVLLGENLMGSLLNQFGFDVNSIFKLFLFQNLSKVVGIAHMDTKDIYTLLISGLIIWGLSIIVSILFLKDKEYK